MARQRSRVADYLVYLVVRVVVCVFQMLSFEQARRLARLLGWLAYRLDSRHRLVALDNLRHAFGEHYSEPQREAIVRAVYEHFCTLAVEMIQLPRRLHPTTWRRHVHDSLDRRLVERALSGRPMLLVSGHFGNWELAGYVTALFGFENYAIARPLDNPHLDRFVRQFR